MTDIVKLEDADGNVHYTARGSQAAEQLLKDGATDLDAPNTEEVSDGGSPGPGDDHDTGTDSGRSGKRQRTTRTSGGGDAPAGEVQSSPGS